jgi:hypothetical protein
LSARQHDAEGHKGFLLQQFSNLFEHISIIAIRLPAAKE